MRVDVLLSRLRHVRKSGPASWRADCPNPVHDHARGSLAITEADDGRTLMICFACHATSAILAALGLQLADLYPERVKDPSPEGRRASREAFKRDGWRAALNVLDAEATCVAVAAGMVQRDETLTGEDHERLALAVQRIGRAREVLA